jgi:hypothetical protein
VIVKALQKKTKVETDNIHAMKVLSGKGLLPN